MKFNLIEIYLERLKFLEILCVILRDLVRIFIKYKKTKYIRVISRFIRIGLLIPLIFMRYLDLPLQIFDGRKL